MEEGFDACIHYKYSASSRKSSCNVQIFSCEKKCSLEFGSMIDIVGSDKVPDSLKCIYHDQNKVNKRKTRLPIK